MTYQTVVSGCFVASEQGPAPRKATSDDIAWILTWVQAYEVSEGENPEFLEMLHVCQEWLTKQMQIKYHQERVIEAKKQYAKENGISYKQVRIQKGGK